MADLDIQPWDYGVLTGTDTNGRRHVGLPVCVSTVSPADGDGPSAVKFWPLTDEPGCPPGDYGDGKLWFWRAGIESYRVTSRDCPGCGFGRIDPARPCVCGTGG